MSASTNNQNTPTKNSTSLSTKMKGGAKVATGLGNTVRGTTFGAIDSVENRDSSTNDEIARRGRLEIEEGIAMIKGRPATSASAAMGPNNSLQGWGSGINGANADATTNATGFPPPRGQEYAQNSTTAHEPSDLGRGPNALSGNSTSQPPSYPTPSAPYGQDAKATGGMGYTHPTQVGNRPTTGDMVGDAAYTQRRDADQL